MELTAEPSSPQWALWRKILFRFFFIYLLIQIVPWWFNLVPGSDYVTKYYFDVMDWLVKFANAHFYHIKEELVYPNGSGDTSFGWADQWTSLIISFIGCLIWSIADRKRKNYKRLNYWLCLVTRYFVALVCFIYGFDKILLMQMPFPSQSQLATPLGDFLPMRLSWLFIGYSAPYEIFSGLMECFAALLLLYRRTITLGVLVSTGVFVNVMMLNLSYDIPVKIFSINMVLTCLFLLANEHERIICFFILNRPASTCSLYHFSFKRKSLRITRWILKIAFLAVIIFNTIDTFNYSKADAQSELKPIKNGIYNVAVYAINHDTIPALVTDTLRWLDFIVDKNGYSSIKTTDTLFRQRYRRGYFVLSSDTAKQILNFKRFPDDSIPILSFHYTMPDSNTIQLWGKNKMDSLYVELVKSNRHFQLAEKQFHWLSEANR